MTPQAHRRVITVINGDRCRTCQYSPALGGRCEMAVLEPLPGGNDE
jgi:hypothetical protein